MRAIDTKSEGVRLVVAHTWDGEPLEPSQQTEVVLRPTDNGLQIRVDAPYHNDPPPPGPPEPTDGLWNYEVVEIFIAGPGEPVPYTEIELSPHGHYLVLKFLGIRQRAESLLPLDFEATIDGDHWSGEALVPWSHLPPAPLRGNAYAIHGTGESRSYLAMTPVPGQKPDFHQPAVFRPLDLERLAP